MQMAQMNKKLSIFSYENGFNGPHEICNVAHMGHSENSRGVVPLWPPHKYIYGDNGCGTGSEASVRDLDLQIFKINK